MDQGWGGVGPNSGFGHSVLKCIRDVHVGIRVAIRHGGLDLGESSGKITRCPHSSLGEERCLGREDPNKCYDFLVSGQFFR